LWHIRSLHSRLKKLEARRGQYRVPRIAVRHEHPDGRVEITESRPPEGDDDETMEIVVQYVETGACGHSTDREPLTWLTIMVINALRRYDQCRRGLVADPAVPGQAVGRSREIPETVKHPPGAERMRIASIHRL
jgi:hypothetical protein